MEIKSSVRGKSNPFSSRYLTGLPYFFPGNEEKKGRSVERFLERFESDNRLGQIVGPHGTGKSTFLGQIETQLREKNFTVQHVVLRDRQRQLPDEFLRQCRESRRKNAVFLVDGYEQLSVFSRLRLWYEYLCWGNGLLLTSHRPVVGVPILYRTAPDFDALRQVLEHLQGNETTVSLERLRALFEKHGGNLRTTLLDLYDEWEHEHARGSPRG